MPTRRSFLGISAATMLGALPRPVFAQGYPDHLIHFMVPFPPAQISDTIARLVADNLKTALGQPVVVENKPGVAGSLGVGEFAKAAPDGYNLLLGATAAFASNAYLYKSVTYNPLRDFIPVAMLTRTRLLLMVGSHVPAKNMTELVKIMKEDPTKLSYASSGYGTISHMTMEAFKLATGGGATHVPFAGIGQSTAAMLGGHVDMMIDAVFTAQQYLKEGRIRPIAVPMPTRDPLLPDVPTFAEVGYPGFGHTSWTAVFVPAGTPRPIVDRLNSEIVKIMAKPEVQQKLEGLILTPSTPAEAEQVVRDDYYYWGDVIKKAGIKVE